MFTDILNSSITHLVLCWRCLPGTVVVAAAPAPPTAAGATVMARGHLRARALQKIPGPVDLLRRCCALRAAADLVYIGAGLVASMRRGAFYVHVDDPVGSFAIGTWVAATSTLGTLVKLAFPEWGILLALMGVVMVVVWVWYVWQIVPAFGLLFAQGDKLQIRGVFSFLRVATQSLVVFWAAVYPNTVNEWLAADHRPGAGLLRAGVCTPCAAVWWDGEGGVWLESRGNTTASFTGRCRITGNAALRSGVLPAEMTVIAIWLWSALMFVLVQGLDSG